MIIRAIILCTTLLLSVPLFAQEDGDSDRNEKWRPFYQANSKAASCVVALGCCVGGSCLRGVGSPWHSRTPVRGCRDDRLLLYRYPSNSYSYVGGLQMPC